MPKCGNCKRMHSTAGEIRACYVASRALSGEESTLATPNVPPAASYGYGSPTHPSNGPSARQEAFLASLMAQRPTYCEANEISLDGLNRSEASRLIDQLLNIPVEATTVDPRPGVPEGRYALPADDGHMVFYQVDKPTTGRWSGYLFVKMLLGAPGDFSEERVNTAQQDRALLMIEADPVAAALAFSRKFTVCARCLSPLSQVRSRATGFGPVCSDHLGVRYLPRDEALRLLDEEGITKEGLEDLEV